MRVSCAHNSGESDWHWVGSKREMNVWGCEFGVVHWHDHDALIGTGRSQPFNGSVRRGIECSYATCAFHCLTACRCVGLSQSIWWCGSPFTPCWGPHVWLWLNISIKPTGVANQCMRISMVAATWDISKLGQMYENCRLSGEVNCVRALWMMEICVSSSHI